MLLLAFSTFLFVSSFEVNAVNNRPIIGILSQRYEDTPGLSYIAASYVKYLESAGARVVPISNALTEEDLEHIIPYINGVLFPGGGANLNDSGYFEVAEKIYNLVLKMNDNGDYFPLWGTCLGFQLLCVLTSETSNVVGKATSYNVSLPLQFTTNWPDSRLYQAYTSEQKSILDSQPVTANFHHFGVLVDTFEKVSKLNTFYRLLSANDDDQGAKYCSMIEGKKYPIYGSQWHPEKNTFEWSMTQDLNHDFAAVSIAQATANFFVNEARKSSHKFASEKEQSSWLIYNYSPVYTGKAGAHFEQTYVFKNSSNRSKNRLL